jgi:NAD(P)-dependent dehydrogenase (short-subunit alcohol dehydrogenase family)
MILRVANVHRPVQKVHTSFKRDDLLYGCVGPDDIARGIAFLASDDAKMINGVLMPIDNAWSTI